MTTIYDDNEILEQLDESYGLTILNGHRSYEYIKSKFCFDMRGSSPYCVKIFSQKIFSVTWSKLLFNLLTYLDSLVYKTDGELLNIKNEEYIRRDIFSRSIRRDDKSFCEFRPGLYFHNAVDANFAVAIIFSLLDAYDIDLDDVSLYIRLAQCAEPRDAKNYVIEKNKNFFRESLLSLKLSGVDDSSINEIIKFVDYLSNKYLVSSYSAFDQDLFLFDNYDDFTHCSEILSKQLERDSIIKSIVINWGDDDKKEPTPEELQEQEEKKERAMHELEYGKKVLEYLDYYYMMLDDLSSLDY